MTIFTVSWRNEKGQLKEEVIFDDTGILEALLPVDDPLHCCLNYIDRQGITIFAEHQMQGSTDLWSDNGFLKEWQLLRTGEFSQEADDLLSRIEYFAQCCHRHPHTQLWFEARQL